MQIAQILAGYTLGGADLLRRAMGKKKPEEMAKQREIFTNGASDRAALPKQQATRIFDLMEKVRRVRLQQVPLGRLCAAVVPDRLAEGASPGRVSWRRLCPRISTTPTSSSLSRQTAAAERASTLKPPCGQCLRATNSPWQASDEIRYGLGAVKGVGRSIVDAIRRRAPDQWRAVRFAGRPFVERVGLGANQPAGRRSADQGGRVRSDVSPNRKALLERSS